MKAATQYFERQGVSCPSKESARELLGDLPTLMLPITEGMARAEADAKAVATAKIAKLKDAGVDVSAVPQSELDTGTGPVLNAELQWVRHIAHCRANGRETRAASLQTLLTRIEDWRDTTAERLRMAPAKVLPSHLAKIVAYSMPTTTEGLVGAGVRIAGVDTLAALITSSIADLPGLRNPGSGDCSGGGGRAMRLGVVTPASAWRYAVYKPKTRKGHPPEPPPWEVSWDRFHNRGESVEAIAMTQVSGRAINPSTVTGHLLEAIAQGRPVDFERLYSNSRSVPNESEWERISDAAAAINIDPQGDPANYSAKEVLKGILGEVVVDKDRELKTEAERNIEMSWYSKMKVWVALKRAGQEPQWMGDSNGSDTKKRRMY